MSNRSPIANGLLGIVLAAIAAVGLLEVNPAQARWGRGGGGWGGGGGSRRGGGGGFRGFGGGGSGFHFGGDGFGGGDTSHNSWSQGSSSHSQYGSYSNSGNQYKSEHPSNTTNTYNQYNTANSSSHPYGTTPQEQTYNLNQTRYNEASTLQQQQYQNEKSEENQRYNANMSYMNTANNNGWEPYGGCCGYSEVWRLGCWRQRLWAWSAEWPLEPRWNRQRPQGSQRRSLGTWRGAGLPIGTTVPVLPQAQAPTQINGQYYYYSNGSYYKPVFNGSQVVYVVSAV